MKMTEPRPRYVLFDRIATGEIESFLARAPTGDRVMVHMVDPSSPRGRTILEGLDRLGADDRARVRTIDSVDGAPVIVTDVLRDFASLPGWLDVCLRPPPAPETGGGDAAGGGEDDSGPGEFTRLFQLGGTPAPSSGRARATESDQITPPRRDEHGPEEEPEEEEEARAGRPQRSEPADTPAASGAEPGEFTSLFLMQDALERSRETADDAATGRLPSDPKSEPSAPEAPDRTDPFEPLRPERREPGDRGRAAAKPPGEESRRTGGDPPAAGEPGEFTSLFSPGAAEKELGRRSDPPGWDDLRDPPGRRGSPSKEPPPLRDGGDDYLERLGETTRGPDRDAAPSPMGFGAAETDPGEPEAAPGPSRYTQVLTGSAGPPAMPRSPEGPKPRSPEPESSTESPEPESSPPSKRPYVIAAVVIVVVAIAFIAFLAWSARDSSPGEEPAGADEPVAALGVNLPAGAG